ncbi:Fe-S cluster assembly protein NifU [Leptothermofonsia sichuanensis E412]|jgi:NifU-like protein|uniref:Fe-S cluster assembly protein NifU n=1 Tax=Leptothermofonsia sichuanensis TaxID=2917832 RepID=UPI001CA79BF5|nr:Fe-S cluster assembly protein NifU [Leptothermofonsia sichuanensis]QZZ18655.1 Fe-S cluster assembly protein NifU [Leptothermofonsia sichuanensis E412]
MWDYTEKVLDLFYNPKNQGAIEDLNEAGIAVVFGEVGSIACGDALRLHLKIEVDTDKILDSRFQTFGCTSAIASSSALTEIIKGLTLDEALNISNRDIANYLGGLPEEKMHCSVMGQEALEAAIYKYRGIEIEHHEEDDGKLICSCFGVSENRIRRVVIENNLTTVEQVTSYVKAGGGCSSCSAEIEDLIATVHQEKELTAARVAAEIATAQERNRPLTTVQKISLIQNVLQEVRPVLVADGGDVELYDIEGDVVKVILKGACGSCDSSTATLKNAIEVRLRERVLPGLVVEAVA